MTKDLTGTAHGILEFTKIILELQNENKVKIIRLIADKEKSITALAKQMDLNYKTVYDHVYSLERMGYVQLEKDVKAAGKPVKAKLTPRGLHVSDLFNK